MAGKRISRAPCRCAGAYIYTNVWGKCTQTNAPVRYTCDVPPSPFPPSPPRLAFSPPPPLCAQTALLVLEYYTPITNRQTRRHSLGSQHGFDSGCVVVGFGWWWRARELLGSNDTPKCGWRSARPTPLADHPADQRLRLSHQNTYVTKCCACVCTCLDTPYFLSLPHPSPSHSPVPTPFRATSPTTIGTATTPLHFVTSSSSSSSSSSDHRSPAQREPRGPRRDSPPRPPGHPITPWPRPPTNPWHVPPVRPRRLDFTARRLWSDRSSHRGTAPLSRGAAPSSNPERSPGRRARTPGSAPARGRRSFPCRTTNRGIRCGPCSTRTCRRGAPPPPTPS